MSKMKDSEILDGAADLLGRRGAWTKGDLRCGDLRQDGQACALGAILTAGGLSEEQFLDRYEDVDYRLFNDLPAADILAKTIGLSEAREIPDWNDATCRKKSQVIKAFRKAATTARIKEMQDNIPEDIMAEETAPAPAPASKPLGAREAAIAKMDGHKRDPQVKKLLEDAAKK
jgi:hypothetical protein